MNNKTYTVTISEKEISCLLQFTLALNLARTSATLLEWLDGVLKEIDGGKSNGYWGPEWETLPEWIVAIAQDSNGIWYGYETIPFIGESGDPAWGSSGGTYAPLIEDRGFPNTIPWRQSLRVRKHEHVYSENR